MRGSFQLGPTLTNEGLELSWSNIDPRSRIRFPQVNIDLGPPRMSKLDEGRWLGNQ